MIQRIQDLKIIACVHAQSRLTFVTPWTAARQASLFMAFSRQEYWSGLPFPSPRDLPNPGIKPASPALAGGSFPLSSPGKPLHFIGHQANVTHDNCCYAAEGDTG